MRVAHLWARVARLRREAPQVGLKPREISRIFESGLLPKFHKRLLVGVSFADGVTDLLTQTMTRRIFIVIHVEEYNFTL